MQDFFTQNQNIITASASGRMDVMGGIADYSGSLVLQMPLKEKTTVQLARRQDNILRIKSKNMHSHNLFSVDVNEIPSDFKEAESFFKSSKNGNWAAYVAGCLVILKHFKGIGLHGFDIYIESQVPNGKGVSSSAALEVATMKALGQYYNLDFEGTELPRLAQKVENLIVGAPCGLMDQLASYFGTENHLLPIVCQPDKLENPFKIPQELYFIGIDSGIRHAVSGASYSDVRTAAFMGYSIIAQSLGISIEEIKNAKESSNSTNLPYQGYLANICSKEFEMKYLPLLSKMTGKEFIERFGDITDPISKINPEAKYDIVSCTSHPVYENERVLTFKNLLEDINLNEPKEYLDFMGQLMYLSHKSYSKCGLGNKYTDKIVALAQEFGHEKGIFGAKITGGGSGGTVCILVHGEKGIKSAKEIYEIYKSTNFPTQNLVLFA
ncbi:MAG: galactokinase [Spirosomataceae bacterium]